MVMQVKKATFQRIGSVYIAHTYEQRKQKKKIYITFRAEFTGHNSVLFVIALILVTDR
jgi:hypothetical protein